MPGPPEPDDCDAVLGAFFESGLKLSMPAREPMGVDPETLAAHVEGVKALARSLLRDEGLAEDVVQDACP